MRAADLLVVVTIFRALSLFSSPSPSSWPLSVGIVFVGDGGDGARLRRDEDGEDEDSFATTGIIVVYSISTA